MRAGNAGGGHPWAVHLQGYHKSVHGVRVFFGNVVQEGWGDEFEDEEEDDSLQEEFGSALDESFQQRTIAIHNAQKVRPPAQFLTHCFQRCHTR
jgi:hypothetical protein